MAYMVFMPREKLNTGYKAWFFGTSKGEEDIKLKNGYVKPVEGLLVTNVEHLSLNDLYIGYNIGTGKRESPDSLYNHPIVGEITKTTLEIKCSTFDRFIPKMYDKGAQEIAQWYYRNIGLLENENKIQIETLNTEQNVRYYTEETEIKPKESIENIIDESNEIVKFLHRTTLGNVSKRYSEDEIRFMRILHQEDNPKYAEVRNSLDVATKRFISEATANLGKHQNSEEEYYYLAKSIVAYPNEGYKLLRDVIGKWIPKANIKIDKKDIVDIFSSMNKNWLPLIYANDTELDASIETSDFTKVERASLKKAARDLATKSSKMTLWLGGICLLAKCRGKGLQSIFNITSLYGTLPQIVKADPYDLSLISKKINVHDLDRLAIAVGKFDSNNKKMMIKRCSCQLLRESENTDSTLLDMQLFDEYNRDPFGDYIEINSKLPNIDYSNSETCEKLYGLKSKKINIDETGLMQNYREVLKDAESKGLIVKIGNKYGITSDIDKEMYIYFKLKYLANKKLNLKFNLDETIQAFESLKDEEMGLPSGTFKLELKQRDAVAAINNSVMVLTGGPGRGKTTTAEAMLYAIEKSRKLTEEQISFAAPTGRAATRLKEVVKRPTKTLHSKYKILSSDDDYGYDKIDDTKVIFVDESSMINLDLMFRVLMKIKEDTQIIFLGDKDQLPPIGKGKPFVDSMSYIPCVVLDVAKRSGAQSSITKNCDMIAQQEFNSIFEYDRVENRLKQDDDFKCLQRQLDYIIPEIVSICKYHSNKLEYQEGYIENAEVSLDDIQIVSPLRVANPKLGSDAINAAVHDIFNPRLKDESDYIMGKDENSIIFRLRDRVIHTKNMYKKVRYKKLETTGNRCRIQMTTCEGGVCNGEMGKIEAYFPASRVEFVEPSEPGFDNFIKEMIDDRLDPIKAKDTGYFIVKYPDCDSEYEEDYFYILYEAKIENRLDMETRDVKKHIRSSEMADLDLAYALTVHKLQGSQAKMIIMAIDYARNMSRNMIYTGISRARKYCYLVGTVYEGGFNNKGQKRKVSTVAMARKNEEVSKRITLVSNYLNV